ncbi:MAG TPA: DUF61 family protein [Syntrophales bacterium]|nr:DUF61 family protein [Syntrophales bacterium]HQN78220.1 DUF61 family protein [Syntrophales bacterium]HQQ27479.1 DUF61 family protein [Syntrophales bacterium]
MPIDGDSLRDRWLDGGVAEDLRILNTQAPRARKTLAALLREDTPFVSCQDGGEHHFRKSELLRLASMLEEWEREELLLPILIEVSGESGQMTVRTKTGVEEKVLGTLLGMPVDREGDEIYLSRAQLPAIRRLLKSSTQYLFLI